MIRYLIIMFLSISWVAVSAHETDEAYFLVDDESSTLRINAEFPWTLRKALSKAYPDLEKSEDAFNQALFNYFNNNLVVLRAEGENNPLQKVLKLEHEGHNHSVKYALIFQYKDFSSIKNTLMFNFSSHQKNIMSYRSKEFVCDLNQPSFNPDQEQKAGISKLWWLALLIISGVFFVYKELQ